MNINTCDMCVILSTRKGVNENEDPTLVDKSAILCSLNIKSMTFDDTVGLIGKNKKLPSKCILSDVTRIVMASMWGILKARAGRGTYIHWEEIVGKDWKRKLESRGKRAVSGEGREGSRERGGGGNRERGGSE